MRRIRKEGTKVWHNPELESFAKHRGLDGQKASSTSTDRRETKQHRAALEALFTPKLDPVLPAESTESRRGATSSASTRSTRVARTAQIVLTPPPQSDPSATERQRLLAKMLAAEGRPNISKAANEFLRAGFQFPLEQDVYLKLLEHSDETHVRDALDALNKILVAELPQRRAVLESRLRRIEEFADESSTRMAAEQLRRVVNGRAAMPPLHAAHATPVDAPN